MRSEDLQQLRVCCTFLFVHTFKMRRHFRQKAETVLHIVHVTLIARGFGSCYQGRIGYSPFVTCQTESTTFQLRFLSHRSVVGNQFTSVLIYHTCRSLLINISKYTVYIFLDLPGCQVTISALISRLQQMQRSI